MSAASPLLNIAVPEVQVANAPLIGIQQSPEPQSSAATAFWNNVAAGAGAFSADYQNTGTTWGKGRILVKSLLANTFTVQVSIDGVNWYDLTQDNAGTLFTIATVAGHLSAARDLPGPIPPHLRLVVITADTVSAGIMVWGI